MAPGAGGLWLTVAEHQRVASGWDPVWAPGLCSDEPRAPTNQTGLPGGQESSVQLRGAGAAPTPPPCSGDRVWGLEGPRVRASGSTERGRRVSGQAPRHRQIGAVHICSWYLAS